MRSCANENYRISVAQYMCASDGGFASNYFTDDEACPSYLCFLCLGNEIEPDLEFLQLRSWERQHASGVMHHPADSIPSSIIVELHRRRL